MLYAAFPLRLEPVGSAFKLLGETVLDILIQDRNKLALENKNLHEEVDNLNKKIQDNIKEYNDKINQLGIDEKNKYDIIINNLRNQLVNIQTTCNEKEVKLQQQYKENEAKFMNMLNGQNLIIFNENSKLQTENKDLILKRDTLIKVSI